MSGEVEEDTLSTNLILHHSITDVLGQAGEVIHILGAVQES